MFSFFRKNRSSKDQNTDQRPGIGTSFDDANKAKVKSDRKSANKDRKIPFRSGTQPDGVSSGDGFGIPAVIINNESSSNNISYAGVLKNETPVLESANLAKHKLRESESFDEFCEAQETPQQKVLPEIPDAEDCEFLEANETVQHQESTSSASPTDLNGATLPQQPCHQSGNLDTINVLERFSLLDTPSVAKEDERPNVNDMESKNNFEPPTLDHSSNNHDTLRGNILQKIAPCGCNPVAQFPEQGSVMTRNIPIITVSCEQSDETMSTTTDQPNEILRLMEEKVHQLEIELSEKDARMEELEAAVMGDTDKLELLESEREEEIRLLQEALEEALEEKAEIEAKMLRDASRESQLLDDFEWKLGEIEREYRKKLAEAEKATEERVKKEMAAEYQQLLDDKRDIDEKLAEITHLKSYEAEVTQLRGLIHEQQRAIRVAARQVDQLRNNERSLQDDLKKIQTQGYTRAQQLEMEEKWEKKTQAECNRLRQELIVANEEEMLKAIRQVVREKDDQIAALKRQHETQHLALTQQITELKSEMQNQAKKFAKELDTTRTTSDRELWDLRRELNKAQDMHIETIEELRRKQAEEIEQVKSSLGGTKEAIEQAYQEQLSTIQLQQQNQLVTLQSMAEEEKQEALTELGEHYQSQLQSLREYVGELQKKIADIEREKQEEIHNLQEIICNQESELNVLRNNPREEYVNNEDMRNSRSSSSESSRSSASRSSTSSDDAEATPPTGRSAGDGCSPSTSTAASQDNLRPCLEEGRSISPKNVAYEMSSLTDEDMLSKSLGEQMNIDAQRLMCCEDPEHLEAQQIILEMHQVLADRDAELQRLTEEKRFYQLELIHWERNLALQRAGLPLSLVPDRYISDNEFNPWRGYSAPPVTKPRLPEGYPVAASAAYDAERPISYDMYSPSEVSLSPEPQDDKQVLPVEQLASTSSGFPFAFDPNKPYPPILQHDENYFFSDEDDDSNNNGFTTPL